MEKANDLHIAKFTDVDYMKTVELCVSTGRPLLLENVLEDLEAPMDPVLFKMTFSQVGTGDISFSACLRRLSVLRMHRTLSCRLAWRT